MSKAAFLPSGDPIVLLHCLKYYDKVWSDEIDTLYVLFNSPFNEEIVSALDKAVTAYPKTKFIYAPELAAGGASVPHGRSLKYLTEIATEDDILFIEDDSIIFKKNEVSGTFNTLEMAAYKAGGSPRMSCDARWAEVCRLKFDLNYEGEGDKGPNYWPCFFFCKRDDLLKTDMDFGPKFFKEGEYIKPLDYIVKKDDGQMGGDTFVWGSIQMRDITKNMILDIPQYHAMPNWEYWCNAEKFIWDGKCPWIHFGSLSSGMENVLLDENMIPLRNKYSGIEIQANYPVVETDLMQQEYEHRFFWWGEAWNYAQTRLHGVDFFLQDYYSALEKAEAAIHIDSDRIYRLSNAYKKVIGDLL